MTKKGQEEGYVEKEENDEVLKRERERGITTKENEYK